MKKLLIMGILSYALLSCMTVKDIRQYRECERLLDKCKEIRSEIIVELVYYMDQDSIKQDIIDSLKVGICPTILIEELKQSSSLEKQNLMKTLLLSTRGSHVSWQEKLSRTFLPECQSCSEAGAPGRWFWE